MKQPTFHGRVLLPLSVFADARAGDPLAMERILRYYDGYMNKLCTRTLYELDGSPHVRVDEYMKHRLQNKLIRAILKDSLSVLQQESLNAPISDYGYANLVNGVIWNNMGFFLPVTLMLLGGYMINREYTDDTLKEIFTIPISYKKLMLGKIGALLILSILYSCYSFLLATGVSVIFYPGGLNGMAVIKALIQICGMGLCICISILPFVCWCGAAKNRFWVGTVLVFVYGFLGIPLAGHGFQDYYPISAGLSIIQYSGDTGSTATNFRPEIAIIVLIVVVVISLFILVMQEKRRQPF